ncbi:flavin reductase (DIM6/NTAB) family NADH-FMN oxidoreductase RutF [Isoptericola jiangsuensis]|uniref:Flavin reductase (DIM6/NTAB) family NADH-FMN oxidoreductase RutF n=1 Tax=Isoptericola jiangsuensis TaxID=548579 RepID=A0A2A9EUD1_9MICO|nr:flavin reductase family protein [Isoptericola jiangsuensis]PFG41882.1 flavin reductase (DIM6/NTAB) family NADH-FMN oxidoreductase RutF [Isoptericola jiangsuensis]
MTSTSRTESVTDGFRDAMAGLASGVCVVTTSAGGSPAGLTTTAVMSVSLDPPLVAVGVGRTSRTLAALREARAFVLHVLHHDREATAAVFASRSADKFAGLEVRPGRHGIPVLADDARYALECTTWQEVDAGDHVLLLGRVDEVHRAPAHEPHGATARALVHFERTFHRVGGPAAEAVA